MGSQSPDIVAPVATSASTGLRHEYLSFVENLAQTVGILTPSGTVSVIIPLLILSAANATWLLMLVTMSMFLLVMFSVMKFASLHSSAGSLATYSRLGWGERGGLIGGWVYLLGMSYCVPSALLASASYVDVALIPALGPSTGPLRLELITAALTLVCWYAARRDVKLSTDLMLVIESVSVTVMVVLLVAGMIHTRAWVDHDQIALKGLRFSGFQGGLVLAFMLIGGFEGTTSLGEESKDPTHTIPKAIFRCLLPVMVVYLLVAYCMVSLGNRGVIGAQIDGLTVPFDNIAQALGLPWLGPVSSVGVALSYFACGLASLTVASRVLFSMARDGQFLRRFGSAHPVNATPHRAIALVSAVSLVLPVGALAAGADLSVSISFLSQLGSLGLIGGYFMVVLALPAYLRSRGLLRNRDVVLAGAASLMLLGVLVLSVYPIPALPYNLTVYVFVASVLVGIAISVGLSISGKRRLAAGADSA